MSKTCIFFVVDDGYFPLALTHAVALERLGYSGNVSIFLETKDRNKALFLPNDNVTVHVNVLSDHIDDLASPRDKYRNIIYGRLFAPRYLTDFDFLLYLDADTALFGAPFDRIDTIAKTDFALAAVADSAELHARTEGGSGPQSESLAARGMESLSYFNSGSLLIRPKPFNEEISSVALQSYLEQHRADIRFPDQDYLNFIFQGRWAQLLPRMNFQTPMITAGFEPIFDPVIYHYYGGVTPWRRRRGRLQQEHYDYFLQAREAFPKELRMAKIFDDGGLRGRMADSRRALMERGPLRVFRYATTKKNKARREKWARVYADKLASEPMADLLPGEAERLIDDLRKLA